MRKRKLNLASGVRRGKATTCRMGRGKTASAMSWSTISPSCGPFFGEMSPRKVQRIKSRATMKPGARGRAICRGGRPRTACRRSANAIRAWGTYEPTTAGSSIPTTNWSSANGKVVDVRLFTNRPDSAAQDDGLFDCCIRSAAEKTKKQPAPEWRWVTAPAARPQDSAIRWHVGCY